MVHLELTMEKAKRKGEQSSHSSEPSLERSFPHMCHRHAQPSRVLAQPKIIRIRSYHIYLIYVTADLPSQLSVLGA